MILDVIRELMLEKGIHVTRSLNLRRGMISGTGVKK